MLDLPPANNWEHVGSLLHDIRNGHRGDALCANLIRDLLEGEADLTFVWGAFPAAMVEIASVFSCLAATFFLGVGTDLALAQDIPRSKSKTYGIVMTLGLQ